MTAIAPATSILTVTVVLGLVLRAVAPQLPAVLRELSIRHVVALIGRGKLSPRTGLATIDKLTAAGNAPAAGKIQRAAGARKGDRTDPGEAITSAALRQRISRNRSDPPEATIDAKSA